MYKIYKIDEDLYQLHSTAIGVKAMEGTRLAVMMYAITKLGFEIDEIERGMLSLIENEDHDSLDYGIYKSFILSYQRERKAA